MDMSSMMMGVDAPPSASAYKRAVLRFAPKEFSVEVLSPAKHGSTFSYGLRISPIRSDARSVHSEKSWTSDYEIWRRWEDCLHFQDILEDEYAKMSREKRRRLKSGKGVKKDGVYKTSDFAASFDSLPPGPDYQDVATDIHAYLPKLSKKGSVFRPNPATIALRGQQFEALINALWVEDPPTLIKELRELSAVRDFFGFWRRDHDRLRKSGISSPMLSPGLYGTVSASSVSLVPTTGGIHSARSSFTPPMLLKIRTTDAVSVAPADDAHSALEAPAYSALPPLPPRSPLLRRIRDPSGDDGSAVLSPQDQLLDSTSIKFVLDPSDLLVESTEDLPPNRETVHRPPRLLLTEPRSHGPDKQVASQSPARPPSPSPPPIPTPRTSRKSANIASSTSRNANRNGRIFTSAPNSPIDEDAQFVYVPNAITLDQTIEPPTPSPLPPTSPPIQPSLLPRPVIRVRASPSPRNISPPNSASHSADTCSSGVAPSVFSDDDDSSSRRSSWQTSSSTHAHAEHTQERKRTPSLPVLKEHTPSGKAIKTSLVSTVDRPPISYREPKQQGQGYRLRHSASSLETIQNHPSPDISPRRASSPDTMALGSSGERDMSVREDRTGLVTRSSGGIREETLPSPREMVDLIDTYFDNLTIVRSDSDAETKLRPSSAESWEVSPGFEGTHSRESIHFSIPSPDRFPAPFQHRPPGQFHLPWSPTRPEHTPQFNSRFNLSPPPPVSPPEDSTSTFAIKAMYGNDIVVIKADRHSSLREIRQRIYAKFVRQEGISLSEDFVLSYRTIRTATQTGGRQRSHSTSTISSVSTIDPSQLSFLVLDMEWRNVVRTCGSKLTLIVLDSD